jgi:hypothetical protein
VTKAETPTFKMSEGDSQTETDKKPVLDYRPRKKAFSKPPGSPAVVSATKNGHTEISNRVKLDRKLLIEVGFDIAGATRLALLAEGYAKPADYVANLIGYSLKHADSNPLGMLKYLIERGENRFLKQPKTGTFPTVKKILNHPQIEDISLAEVVEVEKIVPEQDLSRPNYEQIWAEIIRIVRIKLANSSFADLLKTMKLTDLEEHAGKVVAKVVLGQVWQRRLIGSASLALLEQALRTKINRPCTVELLEQ